MGDTIKVGILFSLSGAMEVAERGQFNATMLAIDEVNQKGGVHQKLIEPIVLDCASDPHTSAEQAKILLEEHNVTALFGLYTSASRKAILPILEKFNSILFYPTQYEGEEQHPNVIYCGPLPTQNLIHFIPWITQNLGREFYLVGSDYIYPHEMNQHIHMLTHQYNGEVVGEKYTPLGEKNFEGILQEIQQLKPSVVFSTLVGDSAVAFYKQCNKAEIHIPIVSSITAETEISEVHTKYTTGLYACFPYFSSIQTKENKIFLENYQKAFGSSVVSSAMENAYNSVQLFAKSVEKCTEINTHSILNNLKGLSFSAPQGEITIDKDNQHLWLHSRIGRVNESGKFNILWESNNVIQPIPFSKYYISPINTTEKTLNQFDKELQSKLKKYTPLINELKKGIQDIQEPIVLFDQDGQLISILNEHDNIFQLSFLATGLSVWKTPTLKDSGIIKAFLTKRVAYGNKKSLDPWRTIGIPLEDKYKNLLGVIGIFHFHPNKSQIQLQIPLLKQIASYCVKVVEQSDQYLSTYELLNNMSNLIVDPLFIVKGKTIVFENKQAKQLKMADYDFILELTRRISKEENGNKVLHKKSSNELFEIKVVKIDEYHHIQVKVLNRKPSSTPRKKKDFTIKDIIGMNEPFLKSLYVTKSASKTNANVLLLGESGTGKELFARAIHNESERREKPFIALNCAAIPASLINAELFGYVEGAFTGAKKQGSPGKFELANGGTLFLDEIGDMPIELQATLLRVLQEKEVTRVGGHQTIPIDVRIIAATNKKITEEIAYKGSFRSDLYFRLNVFSIELLPLRERKDDISLLFAHFIQELSQETGLPPKKPTKSTINVLKRYNWPGNIRELRNIVERAFYLAESSPQISVEHLPSYISENSLEIEETTLQPSQIVENVSPIEKGQNSRKSDKETEIIETMLRFKGNITKTAIHLGISRTTLYRKLEQLNLKN